MLLALMLLLSTAPILVLAAEEGMNAEPQKNEAANALQRRAEVMLRIAERTASRIGGFIGKVQGNSNLLESLENAGLLEDFNGNASRFEEAEALLEETEALIEDGNYTLAMEKIRESLAVFRDTYRAMHRVTERFMAAVEAQRRAEGLIVAMNRSLERLEKIENLIDEADGDIADLIEQARDLLNIEEARELIEAGNVSEAAHRLAEANKIMNQIHVQLKARARMMIRARVTRYLRIAERFRENIMERIRIAQMAGVNVTEVLQKLGIENATAFREEFTKRIQEAREKGDIDELLDAARDLGNDLWKIDRTVTLHIAKHLRERNQHGPFGNGGFGREEQSFSQQGNSTENPHPAEKHRGGRGPGGGGE